MRGHFCELRVHIMWNVANRDAERGVLPGEYVEGGGSPYGIFHYTCDQKAFTHGILLGVGEEQVPYYVLIP